MAYPQKPSGSGSSSGKPFPKTRQELLAAGYVREKAGVCRSDRCKKTIEWWVTPNGKFIPLDPGTLVPHWTTCVDAGSFRGGKR